MKTKPKVGCLTTFYNFRPEFSLCGVVRQQLIALAKYGYEPVLFVLENFEGDVPEGVEVRKVLPQITLEPYTKGQLTTLEQDVPRVQKAMEENMKDIDVCLTHDIIFINSYLPYNEAMRRGIDGRLSHVKWLHWMHSGPSRRQIENTVWDDLVTLPKNSRLVYMNYTDVDRASEMYHTLPKDVRTIFNPMDIRELYEFDDLTKEIIEDNDLMSPDFICVYPLSSTRMDTAGKQLSKVIWIMAELKKKGSSVRLVVPNAHANAQREKDKIQQMYKFGYEHGLERRELIFTSLHKPPAHEQGVPNKVVRELFLLGNLFIFPSVSENCPLILLEAMASKNLLVLNKNFLPMKDFALENALYFEFGALTGTPNFGDGGEQRYMEDRATLILSEYNQNKALKAQARLRKDFNIDTIFKKMLEPAILESYNG